MATKEVKEKETIYQIIDGPDRRRVERAMKAHPDCKECRTLKFSLKESPKDKSPEYWNVLVVSISYSPPNGSYFIYGYAVQRLPYQPKRKKSVYIYTCGTVPVQIEYIPETKTGKASKKLMT